MSTYGNRLVELSTLSTGTASEHFLTLDGLVYVDSYSEDAIISISTDEAIISISSDEGSLSLSSDESTITLNSSDSTITISDSDRSTCL